jgi:TonB family protein
MRDPHVQHEAPAFTHLLASNPIPQTRVSTAATVSSLLFHGVLVGGLVWATSAMGNDAVDDAEDVYVVALSDDADAAALPSAASLPKPQTLTPALTTDVGPSIPNIDVIVPDIPAPGSGPDISEPDYAGGVERPGEGGEGQPVTPEDIELAPKFVPRTIHPELLNRLDAVRSMERRYPPLLRDAGVGGRVIVWVLIDENGVPIKSQVQQSSGQPALDAAAMEVTQTMRFRPAQNRDKRVKVWVQIPVDFSTR